ncbi:glycosyltransferase [Novosphingobium aquimarinum]|uniref:glycosyltransferase n=1 Tax=Novosphingobium aquimarinum TaxID=2682494 RepID=UPI0012EC47BC|nr:glycosyltransferase [Novosphingobium aquimarinum]
MAKALAPVIAALAWMLAAAIGLTYLGFPLALLAVARLAPPRPWHKVEAADSPRPPLCVLISAYNEEAHLAGKLESVLRAAAVYENPVRIMVADDGSSDTTLAIAQRFTGQGVEVLALPRGGKAAALNRLAMLADGDVLVLTDADPLFADDTLVRLTQPFADPAVGAVAGNVVMAGRHGALGRAAGIFRQYESALRVAEDRLFGVVSADGGIYAIRRELMPQVPPDGTDDFHISTAAPMAGRRIAFAPHAKVLEQPMASGRKDLRRRIRITVRGLTALWRRRALMNPRRTGWYAPALFMHKVARRLSPLLLLPVLALSLALAANGSLLWGAVAAAILSLALLALIGWLAEGRIPRLLSIPYVLGLHLFGLGAGVVLFCLGRRFATWTPHKAVPS